MQRITKFPSSKLWSVFSWWGKLFVISIAVFSSSFSVTLPGTYARHPALTRGKPIFLFSVVFGFLGVALFGLGFFFGFVVWVFPPININSYYLKFGSYITSS